MGDEVKKFSFGFNKLVKKPCIISNSHNQIKREENKVEFIDCFEGKSIILKDPIKSEEKDLVIPLKKELKYHSSDKEIDTNNSLSKRGKDDQQDSHLISTEMSKLESLLPVENDKSKLSADVANINDTKCETLDEIATREILEDLKKKDNAEETRIFSVPLLSNPAIGEKESTIEDYENIPVNDFGLAMLRGMGWAPGKGIGKNEKLVAPSMPTLRPKGMGLGADKVIKAAVDNKADIENLTMTKGSFVRVLAGQYKDSYGQIEGFDDESCRLIVKISLKNTSVSLNEFMVQLVDKGEFTKNSKVINVGKYEQYKKYDERKESNEETLQKASEEKFEDQDYKHSSKTKDSRPKSHKNYSKPNYSTSSESEKSERKKIGDKVKESPRKSKIKSDKIRSRSSSRSTDEIYRDQRYSRSLSTSRRENKDNHHKGRSDGRHHRRQSSGSSDTSSSSGYSRKRKSRPSYKKKSNSHKHKTRSHSRSPRKHSMPSHKKHKKYK